MLLCAVFYTKGTVSKGSKLVSSGLVYIPFFKGSAYEHSELQLQRLLMARFVFLRLREACSWGVVTASVQAAGMSRRPRRPSLMS